MTKTLAGRQLNLVLILGKKKMKKNFSVLASVKTDPRAHPASFSVHTAVSVSEVMNELCYISATHKCLHGVQWTNFHFTGKYCTKLQTKEAHTIECPTRYRIRHFFNNFTTNEDIATKFEADLPHCVRNVKEKNVLLFKFRCNIFIGVRIIKEMPGSVASGTPCIIRINLCL